MAPGWVIQLWQYNKNRKKGCPRKKKDGWDSWEPLDGETAARVASLFGHRFPRYGKLFTYSEYEYVHTGYMRGLQVSKKTGATRKIRNNPDNNPMDSPNELDYTPSQPSGPSVPVASSAPAALCDGLLALSPPPPPDPPRQPGKRGLSPPDSND